MEKTILFRLPCFSTSFPLIKAIIKKYQSHKFLYFSPSKSWPDCLLKSFNIPSFTPRVKFPKRIDLFTTIVFIDAGSLMLDWQNDPKSFFEDQLFYLVNESYAVIFFEYGDHKGPLLYDFLPEVKLGSGPWCNFPIQIFYYPKALGFSFWESRLRWCSLKKNKVRHYCYNQKINNNWRYALIIGEGARSNAPWSLHLDLDSYYECAFKKWAYAFLAVIQDFLIKHFLFIVFIVNKCSTKSRDLSLVKYPFKKDTFWPRYYFEMAKKRVFFFLAAWGAVLKRKRLS